jgi:hypothetical protein
MSGSLLQAIKDLIPLPAPSVFVLAGLGCYFATCFVARRPLTWAWALLPGLLLSLVIESWEVWDYYGTAGFAGESVLGIIGRHLKDVALMNALPVAVCVVASFLEHGPAEPSQ